MIRAIDKDFKMYLFEKQFDDPIPLIFSLNIQVPDSFQKCFKISWSQFIQNAANWFHRFLKTYLELIISEKYCQLYFYLFYLKASCFVIFRLDGESRFPGRFGVNIFE